MRKESEKFVTNKMAENLKAIGFNEPCMIGVISGEDCTGNGFSFLNHPNNVHDFVKPLRQDVFEWFREKHNIDAWVQPMIKDLFDEVMILPDESYSYFIFKDGSNVKYEVDFEEPIDAENECLEKVIEILLDKKTISHSIPEIEFAEWLAENVWSKKNRTHPNKVGQYYSDKHCEYKKIEELFDMFKNR